MDAKNKYILSVYLRNFVIFITGLRYIIKLFIYGFKNIRIIFEYRRSINRITRYSLVCLFQDIIQTTRSFKHLFNVFKKMNTIDDIERKRLRKIYIYASKLCHSHTIKYDPLSAPSAIIFQASAIQNVFHHLFRLSPTREECEILGRYGSIDLAIKDFLEYCGYGNDVSYFTMVQLQYPLFVMWSELRHNIYISRNNYIDIMTCKPMFLFKKIALGRLKYLYITIVRYWCQMYWRYEDVHNMNIVFKAYKHANAELYNEIMLLTSRSAEISQNSILTMLIFEIHIQSIVMLLDIPSESICDNASHINKNIINNHGQLFSIARQRLDSNYIKLVNSMP